jgi:hypothetical protein
VTSLTQLLLAIDYAVRNRNEAQPFAPARVFDRTPAGRRFSVAVRRLRDFLGRRWTGRRWTGVKRNGVKW